MTEKIHREISPPESENLFQIDISNQMIRIHGAPFFVFGHEFQYDQISRNHWETILGQYKRMGINTILLTLNWNLHEIKSSIYDFKSPQTQISALFDLCAKYDLYIFLQLGVPDPFQINLRTFPSWIVNNYPQIFDLKIKSFSSSSSSAVASSKTLIPTHPLFQNLIAKWFENVFLLIQRWLYPEGNIIFIQLTGAMGFPTIDHYFDWGYSPFYRDLYQQWLKNKYYLIGVFNDIYNTHWSTFQDISYPDPPYTFKKLSQKDIVRYLDWIEFKESLYLQFFHGYLTHIRRYHIEIPMIIELLTYKSPMNVPAILGKINVLSSHFPLLPPHLVSYVLTPEIFTAAVNVNCYLTWHCEWLKSLQINPPFVSQLREVESDAEYSILKTHNTCRLLIAHGVHGLFFNRLDYSPRTDSISQFASFLTTHEQTILYSEKTYDPLCIGYYHPVTRLKSFNSSISTLDFQFPLNYEELKLAFKYLLQSLTKFQLSYEVCDLSLISLEDLMKKRFLMVYYLGWMEHGILEKLRKYLEAGGVIFSFGDIPRFNELFEHDNTLADFYQAQSGQILGNSTTVCQIHWQNTERDNILTVIGIATYQMLRSDIESFQILAYLHESTDIVVFQRTLPSGGVIVHSGIFPTADFSSFQLLIFLLEAVHFPTKNVFSSQECVAVQRIAPSEERLLLIGNLLPISKKEVSFTFYDPHAVKYLPELQLDNMLLPASVLTFWHANKCVSPDLRIDYITAEITKISSTQMSYDLQCTFYGHHEYPTETLVKLSLSVTEASPFIHIEEFTLLSGMFLNESTISGSSSIAFSHIYLNFPDPVEFSFRVKGILYLFRFHRCLL